MKPMYQVFIAEDEPAALQHLCNIIRIKCQNFQVVGTAENGQEALEQLESFHPDILITDVKMPVMDGIMLAKRVKERYPDLLTVIISGYQDFSYAQSALRFGVCDYILKPVKPSVLQESLQILKGRLDEYYYKMRNRIIHEMCAGNFTENPGFQQIFPEEEYYTALLRKNSLPRRFLESQGVEFFSGMEEQMIVYGRDEMETLYICPKKLLFHNSFYQVVQNLLEKEKKTKTMSFYTLILTEKPVSAKELFPTIRRLIYILDHRLIIGKNQTIEIGLQGEKKEQKTETQMQEEKLILERLRILVRKHDFQAAEKEIEKLFRLWEIQEYSQLCVEQKVRELFQIFKNENVENELQENAEYLLDDLFYYTENMQKLKENISQILCRNKEEQQKGKIDTPDFFEKIENYMKEQLALPLSAQKICTIFGISQTYLSKLFRKYSTESFNRHLATLRIEKAKEIMEDKPDLFIKDIAAMVGFSDQFYFSRIFHSITGMSPAEYMKNHKGISCDAKS